MYQLLITQYELIKGARQALFSYCDSMAEADLFKKVGTFNNSCIADLLLHNANTYIGWINNLGLDRIAVFHKTEDFKNLNEIKSLFDEVDAFMTEFLEKYQDKIEEPFTGTVKHRALPITVTPLQLFTHVTTHEFHHKGQMLTMSRLLGYVPADTDIIRFGS